MILDGFTPTSDPGCLFHSFSKAMRALQTDEEVEAAAVEAHAFALASHQFWGTWALYQVCCGLAVGLPSARCCWSTFSIICGAFTAIWISLYGSVPDATTGSLHLHNEHVQRCFACRSTQVHLRKPLSDYSHTCVLSAIQRAEPGLDLHARNIRAREQRYTLCHKRVAGQRISSRSSWEAWLMRSLKSPAAGGILCH